MLTPQEVAERFGVAVDWASIPASKGLTSDQVCMHVYHMHAVNDVYMLACVASQGSASLRVRAHLCLCMDA